MIGMCTSLAADALHSISLESIQNQAQAFIVFHTSCFQTSTSSMKQSTPLRPCRTCCIQGRRNRCGRCRTNILAKTQSSRVSACSEARTLCNGKEKMTYFVEYVCMSSGWPHQSLSASDAPGIARWKTSGQTK